MPHQVLLGMLDSTWVDHGRRVGLLAVRLGESLGLDAEALRRLEIAAVLHDIGKVHIDRSILDAPRPLFPDEWQKVREHPVTGHEMLVGNVDPLVPATVLAHHERFDGSGYPHGLAGAAIPRAARVLAVADAYDAIVSDRPYDPARSPREALDELVRCAGTQFDPLVVDELCQLMPSARWAWTPDGTRRAMAIA
ncbi:MAG TPA: HD domain-containing phosphohydrolase [Acidimicrobiia bacterium]